MPNLDYMSGISPGPGTPVRELSAFFTLQGDNAVQLYADELQDQTWVVDRNGLFYDMARVDEYSTEKTPKLMSAADQKYMTKSLFGVDTDASAPSAPAYSSTRQAAQEQMAFEREQSAANRKFQAEQEALSRQTQERMNRLRDLNDLIKEAMGNQQSAKETKFAYRNDEFALAGTFSAQGPRGVTPVVAARNELQNYINQPIPTVGPNATLPQINQAITQVPGQVPVTGGFGMAGGGMLPMAPQGAPPMMPQAPQMGTTKVATLIGEGPNTIIEPGTEVAITDKAQGTTEIIPLMGGAATGATLPQLPTAPSTYGAIEDLYRPFGFKNIPLYHNYGQNQGYAGGYVMRGASPDQFSAMGYRPTLIQQAGTHGVYYRDPTSGTLRPFSTKAFEGSGFDYRNVQNVSPEQFKAMGPIGELVRDRLPDIGPDTGNYGPSTTPMFTPYNQLLPNPSYVSQELLDAYNSDPIAWQNYVSAYGSAVGPSGEPMGMTEEQLLARARAPLPTGVPRQVLGYR